MVNDQEPRYRLVDSNGNVVGSLFQNADGNVEIQDETGTGSVFGPNGIVTPAIDAESASVESATIGGWGAWEEIASETVSGQDSLTISLNGKDEYLISYGVDSRSTDTVELTLDGDDTTGNENYAHYDESGVGNGDQDAFLLYDPNQTSTVTGGGIIHIIDITDDRTGLPHSFGFRPAIIGRIDAFSQAGGYNDGPVSGLSQVAIAGAGTESSSQIRMEVLGR